ncbi:hypothetical protein PSM_A1526 [Pseudoalteromonas sp. SM9913]|jgi:hypothetical protein|nr:hypothetical protein PSM_A1526 [Pseudoalteromonas sp. SM9913]
MVLILLTIKNTSYFIYLMANLAIKQDKKYWFFNEQGVLK